MAAGTLSATSLLAGAQRAVDRAGSFELAVQGRNYVLPQWGGVDGGTVAVTRGGDVTATLTRTGDGLYTMIFVNKQTYFERSTCSHWQRVPGGGATVLSPFLWSTTSPLSPASQGSILSETAGTAVVSATISSLGAGTRPRIGIGRKALADLLVDLLQLPKERVTAIRKDVAGISEGKVTSAAKGLPRLAVPHFRIDPLPGGGGEHQVEGQVSVPVLEVAQDHLGAEADKVPAGGDHEIGARLDAGDLKAAAGQREGCLAGGTADLQDAISRAEAGRGDELPKQLLGVVGASTLVGFGD